MKLTKNALLAQWSAKHEYITNEMSQCKHKLELLDKRQKDLMTDLRFAEIYFVASFLLGLFLLYMSKQIFSAFLYFYLPVVALILFFTLGKGALLSFLESLHSCIIMTEWTFHFNILES